MAPLHLRQDRQPLTSDRVQSESGGIVYLAPERLANSAWIEHVPFAFWIVAALRPRSIVELGVHNGVSYCAFCQAVKATSLDTRCYAIDTWQGDEHAGNYGPGVFEDLSAHHDSRYVSFSRLITSRFDDAIDSFEDRSIDLLHIDGYHTYDSVRHDFETWQPKMSRPGVILFHDTYVRERGFGVFKLWDELANEYPSFEFHHGHGLGVLGVGENFPIAVCDLFEAAGSQEGSTNLRAFFAHQGRSIGNSLRISQLSSKVSHLRHTRDDLRKALSKRDADLGNELAALQEALKDRTLYRTKEPRLSFPNALEIKSIDRLLQSWRAFEERGR